MKKQLITVLAGAALTALCSMPVFAGGWRQDGAGRWWYEKDTGSLIVTDLLVDVIVYPDGFIKVVDMDELVFASQSGLLSLERLREALSALDRLLSRLYGGELPSLIAPIDRFDREQSDVLLPV